MLNQPGEHLLLAKVASDFSPKSGESYFLCTSLLAFIQSLPIRWSALKCDA
jgi:hypothetical protein